MVDTPRTLAALQALFADNTTGQVSQQDLRDFLVTVLRPEVVFFVRRLTTHALTNNAFTKIQFNTEEDDPGSDFDAVTNYRYTAPYKGWYHFDATVQLDKTGGTASAAIAIPSIFKNGGETLRGQRLHLDGLAASQPIGVSVSGLLKLNAGDTIEIHLYTSFVDGTQRVEAAWFCGHYVTEAA